MQAFQRRIRRNKKIRRLKDAKHWLTWAEIGRRVNLSASQCCRCYALEVRAAG